MPRKNITTNGKRICYDCSKPRLRSSFKPSDHGRCKFCARWERHQRQRRNSYGLHEGYISYQLFRKQCSLFHSCCVACGQPRPNLQIDHIRPLVLGGTHDICNAQPLCASCNRIKYVHEIDFRPFAVQHIFLWQELPHAVAARRALVRNITRRLQVSSFI